MDLAEPEGPVTATIPPASGESGHDLGVEGALEVGFGALRAGQAPFDVGGTGLGDGVALAFGAGAVPSRLHLDSPLRSRRERVA